MPILQRHDLRIDYADAGEGPVVLLVHGSASSHRQWRKLIDRLSPRYRVVAPNLRGAGETTAWHAQRPQTLADAAEVVLGLVEGLGLNRPLRLVGHSFGASVALQAAHVLGERVIRLALYEPMLPGLLKAHGRLQAAAETQALHQQVRQLGGAGRWLALAERFTDYFSGDGAWAALPAARRQMMADLLRPNLHEWDSAMTPVRADAFAGASAQGLLMRGATTRPALIDMAAVLHRHFGHWRRLEMPDCGHMGPLTHADAVNRHLVDFIDGALPCTLDEGQVLTAV
ncbi:MAG TPA: alpha/beta fold hydrolase [Burkholderiaceae bacterium]|nr:alpha/beta fold hydrolase [Burkholderiaceae bacterium]